MASSSRARRQSPAPTLVLHTSPNGSKRIKGRKKIAAPLAPLGLGPRLAQPRAHPKLVPLSSVRTEAVKWLVPDLIPLGSITIIDGAKAEGKSSLCYDWAARVTSGKPMPFCDGNPITGGAILLQAEDDLGATVEKNIVAAGGVPEDIHVFTKRDALYLDDPEDLQLIQQAAKEINARLLVADPASQFFSKPLLNEKVIRESFWHLMALASSLEMAIILIRHFTKTGSSAIYRGLGGVAIISAARASLVVAHDPSSDDPYQHVLAFNRGNLPRVRDLSLVYRTVKRGDALVVDWLGESKYSADDLVSASSNPDAHSQLQEASYVLYSILTTHGGSLQATEVFEAAKEALVSLGTLKRAKKLLRVRSRRKSFEIRVPVEGEEREEDEPDEDDGKQMELQTVIGWVWELPDDEELLRPYQERFMKEKAEDEAQQGDVKGK